MMTHNLLNNPQSQDMGIILAICVMGQENALLAMGLTLRIIIILEIVEFVLVVIIKDNARIATVQVKGMELFVN